MKLFFATLLGVVWSYANNTLEEIKAANEAHDTPRAINKAVTLAATGLGVVGIVALIVALLYTLRRAIFAIVAPVLMIVVLAKSYAINHPNTSTPTGPV